MNINKTNVWEGYPSNLVVRDVFLVHSIIFNNFHSVRKYSASLSLSTRNWTCSQLRAMAALGRRNGLTMATQLMKTLTGSSNYRSLSGIGSSEVVTTHTQKWMQVFNYKSLVGCVSIWWKFPNCLQIFFFSRDNVIVLIDAIWFCNLGLKIYSRFICSLCYNSFFVPATGNLYSFSSNCCWAIGWKDKKIVQIFMLDKDLIFIVIICSGSQ